jgi:hypothetical protein
MLGGQVEGGETAATRRVLAGHGSVPPVSQALGWRCRAAGGRFSWGRRVDSLSRVTGLGAN